MSLIKRNKEIELFHLSRYYFPQPYWPCEIVGNEAFGDDALKQFGASGYSYERLESSNYDSEGKSKPSVECLV